MFELLLALQFTSLSSNGFIAYEEQTKPAKYFTAEWAEFALVGQINPETDNLLKKTDWILLQERIRLKKQNPPK